jgi:hypothetical protein
MDTTTPRAGPSEWAKFLITIGLSAGLSLAAAASNWGGIGSRVTELERRQENTRNAIQEMRGTVGDLSTRQAAAIARQDILIDLMQRQQQGNRR